MYYKLKQERKYYSTSEKYYSTRANRPRWGANHPGGETSQGM